MPSSKSPSKIVTGSGRLPVSSVASSTASAAFLLEGDYGDLIVSDRGTALRIQDGVVANAKLKPMSANTVKVRDAATEGVPSDMLIQPNTVLGRASLNIVADKVQRAQIADNAVDNSRVADMDGNTVKVNLSSTLGDPSDLVINPGTVLGRRSAGSIVADKIVAEQIADEAVANIKLTKMVAYSVKANRTGSEASPADLPVGTNSVLGRGPSGDLVAGKVLTSQIDNNAVKTAQIDDEAVTNSKLQKMGVYSVKVNNTAADAVPADLTIGASTVLGRRASGGIIAGKIQASQLEDKAVTLPKIGEMTANSVLGRRGSSDSPEVIECASWPQILGRTTGVSPLGFYSVSSYVPSATSAMAGVSRYADLSAVRDEIADRVVRSEVQRWHAMHPKVRCKYTFAPFMHYHYGVDFIVNEGTGRVVIRFLDTYQHLAVMAVVKNGNYRCVPDWTTGDAVRISVYGYNNNTLVDVALAEHIDVVVWGY